MFHKWSKLIFDKYMETKERSLCLSEKSCGWVCNIRNVNQTTVCHANMLHGNVVQFPPIRAEDIFNDIRIIEIRPGTKCSCHTE